MGRLAGLAFRPGGRLTTTTGPRTGRALYPRNPSSARLAPASHYKPPSSQQLISPRLVLLSRFFLLPTFVLHRPNGLPSTIPHPSTAKGLRGLPSTLRTIYRGLSLHVSPPSAKIRHISPELGQFTVLGIGLVYPNHLPSASIASGSCCIPPPRHTGRLRRLNLLLTPLPPRQFTSIAACLRSQVVVSVSEYR